MSKKRICDLCGGEIASVHFCNNTVRRLSYEEIVQICNEDKSDNINNIHFYNKKIVDYKVLEGTPASLEIHVNTHIKRGWQPQGGIALLCTKPHIRYLQVMVKLEQALRDEFNQPPPPSESEFRPGMAFKDKG